VIKPLIRKALGHKTLGAIDYFRSPGLKNRFGGPFNGQQFRQKIFLELIELLRPQAIIETGTYRGATTAFLHNASGLPVYTIEIDPRRYAYSKTRFLLNRNIFLRLGDSREFLNAILADDKLRGKKLFFYLDAHWGEDPPLQEEIEIVFRNCPQAAVMVDDFRVPGDDGYRYDTYKNGKSLTLESLGALATSGLTFYFPAVRSELETGAKRGCAVISQKPEITAILEKASTLKRLSQPREIMIDSTEIKLVGKWEIVNGKPVADLTWQKINMLISGMLVRVGSTDDGWAILYKDPDDGRFWELTFPQGEYHGGGPPALTWLNEQEVKERFPYALP
jgi:predicted O-methyltransferase YrrM